MKNIFRIAAIATLSQIVLGAVAPVNAQVDVTCVSALSNTVVQNVIVPQGATCTLTDVTVRGNIEAKETSRVTIRRGSVNGDIIGEAGSQVRLNRGNVNGSVQGKAAALVSIAGTTVAKDIVIEETATFVINTGARAGNLEVLKSGNASVTGVQISGNLKFEENYGAVSASSNRVGGNFEAFLNLGGATFNSNTIVAKMTCKDNLPAPTGSGNVAMVKEDQCAAL